MGKDLSFLWISQPEPPTPEEQFLRAMQDASITPPATIVFDGALHRFPTSDRKDDDAGWYVAYGDGVPSGSFGDWRAGITQNFRADIGRQLTFAENASIKLRLDEAKKLREAEKRARAERAKESVDYIWENTQPAQPSHPYLERKQIQPHDTHVTGDGRLIIPIYSAQAELVNLQYIDADGKKRYHKDADIRGCFGLLGDPSDRIFVAEGFATAASIYEATGTCTVIAFSAGNLEPCLATMRAILPQAHITIVADNDKPHPKTGENTGVVKAKEAAEKHDATVVYPPEEGTDANDYALSGQDLIALIQPPSTSWLEAGSALIQRPAPLSWLVKHWLQAKATVMLFGPSGCGKTFVALDWLLHIATGTDDWMGQRVRGGDVVYLCGEGHHGLRARMAAWSQANHIHNLDRFFVSRSAADIDKPEGLRLIIQSIREASIAPVVIAIDTLNRFLSGDENSAQDTKVFLDSCAALQEEFGCTMLIIHHTGVAQEAQGRARGSSAWRGALDAEIQVEKGQSGITLKQTKMKDAEIAEPVYLRLSGVTLDGWYDEDGDQVTSAVVVEGEPPALDDAGKDEQCLMDAWQAGGIINAEGDCYLSSQAWRQYLIDHGMTDNAARQALKMDPSRMVYRLVNSGTIKAVDGGYIVLLGPMVARLKMLQNGVKK
jgi:phage/plasmid primase-like uncharacterized protein